MRARRLRWLERALVVLGVLCLGYYAYVSAATMVYQARENRELDAILNSRQVVTEEDAGVDVVPEPRPAEAEDAAATARPPRRRGRDAARVIGRIEIPRLRVSSIVRAGSDARTLQLAVGHIPGTALPGQPGNVGLAGHRDTFFRRLESIRPDDRIRIVTPGKTYEYVVERTVVVEPSDVWVLDPTGHDALTLVTCYPFTYIGTAPQRFIVRAQLALGQTADAATSGGR